MLEKVAVAVAGTAAIAKRKVDAAADRVSMSSQPPLLPRAHHFLVAHLEQLLLDGVSAQGAPRFFKDVNAE